MAVVVRTRHTLWSPQCRLNQTPSKHAPASQGLFASCSLRWVPSLDFTALLVCRLWLATCTLEVAVPLQAARDDWKEVSLGITNEEIMSISTLQ
jgi:hypothetical protein